MSVENHVQEKKGAGDQVTPVSILQPKVKDIEETVVDSAFQKKKLEKILDKTKQVLYLVCIIFFQSFIFPIGRKVNSIMKKITIFYPCMR